MKENKKDINSGSHSIANSLIQNKQNGKSLAAVSTTQLKESNIVQKVEEEQPLQGKFGIIQKKEKTTENKTRLPDNLKSDIENLSGVNISDVQVNYNSDKPVQLNAHGFAQGNQIHITPGQEEHLPHESWHTVQQKQGRVKPTMQMKSGAKVNDDVGLKNEADVMGEIASKSLLNPSSPLQLKTNKKRFNLEGKQV